MSILGIPRQRQRYFHCSLKSRSAWYTPPEPLPVIVEPSTYKIRTRVLSVFFFKSNDQNPTQNVASRPSATPARGAGKWPATPLLARILGPCKANRHAPARRALLRRAGEDTISTMGRKKRRRPPTRTRAPTTSCGSSTPARMRCDVYESAHPPSPQPVGPAKGSSREALPAHKRSARPALCPALPRSAPLSHCVRGSRSPERAGLRPHPADSYPPLI